MKNKTSVILLIVCIALCAALLLSVFSLRAVKSDISALEAQIQELVDENDQLSSQNQALRLQLDSVSMSGVDSTYIEEDYCSLMIDSWSEENGVLSFDALAQLFLTAPANFTARLELWQGDAVSSTQPVTLNETEVSTVFEADLSASFQIPEINEGEELQLWLMIELESGDSLFACGATLTPEDGQFAVIAG